MGQSKVKHIIFIIATIIFIVSLLFWVIIIRGLVDAYINGTNREFIESLGSHEWYYGWEAVEHLWEIYLLEIFLIYFPIPLYQIIYIITMIIRFLIKLFTH
ncbi:hypothetical protein SAMN02910275_02631 [Butyrivibrio sp. INlla18]|nr:hypothetical protein SAMN02910275_02631 [Butyrivibrio sp. INlla18]